jgi:LysR family transcriptional regulator, regulator for bpeEF and oprC
MERPMIAAGCKLHTSQVRAPAMDRLWAMEVFVKVVEAKSLSKAADLLGLANASVTSCIRNLEMHLGVTLLRRSTRHMTLTEEGAAYYERCCSILGLVADAEAVVTPSQDRLRGTLRAELPIALGHLIIGPALLEFARRHPDLQVAVNLTNSIDNLARRGVDVAIRMDEVDDGDLVARWIYEARHVVCASPAFLEKHGVPSHPGDLDPQRCIGLIPPMLNHVREWEFNRGNEAWRLTPEDNLMFNSSDALIRTAARNGGFIYVLDVLADDHVRRGALRVVLPEWQTARKTFYAVYTRSRFVVPKIRLFVDFVSRLFGEQPQADSALVPRILSR